MAKNDNAWAFQDEAGNRLNELAILNRFKLNIENMAMSQPDQAAFLAVVADIFQESEQGYFRAKYIAANRALTLQNEGLRQDARRDARDLQDFREELAEAKAELAAAKAKIAELEESANHLRHGLEAELPRGEPCACAATDQEVAAYVFKVAEQHGFDPDMLQICISKGGFTVSNTVPARGRIRSKRESTLPAAMAGLAQELGTVPPSAIESPTSAVETAEATG